MVLPVTHTSPKMIPLDLSGRRAAGLAQRNYVYWRVGTKLKIYVVALSCNVCLELILRAEQTVSAHANFSVFLHHPGRSLWLHLEVDESEWDLA